MGAPNAGGVGRNHDSEPISGFTAYCELFQWQAAMDHGKFITHIVAGMPPSLLIAGNNDEVIIIIIIIIIINK